MFVALRAEQSSRYIGRARKGCPDYSIALTCNAFLFHLPSELRRRCVFAPARIRGSLYVCCAMPHRCSCTVVIELDDKFPIRFLRDNGCTALLRCCAHHSATYFRSSPAFHVDFWQNFRNRLKAPIVVGRALVPLARAIEASTGSKTFQRQSRRGDPVLRSATAGFR